MKKNIVIWANCQGGPISLMLNKYYSNEYDIHLFANYEYIKNKLKFPDFMYKCDIFMYQNYSDKNDEYNLKNIFNNVIPPNAIKISFPTLHRNHLQFPFDVNSPNNTITINQKHPFGLFYFGIGNIINIVNELKQKNFTNDKIKEYVIKKIDDIDFIEKNTIIKYEQDSLDFLKSKALSSDIPNIYNFIIENYKKIRLYHNPNHPNGILLNELCKEIFIKLNLNYPNESENIKILDNCLNDWKIPIFNSVIKYYEIDNIDNECSSKYHHDIYDINTYINKYIEFLLN
jgi:hypothetical protein